MNERTKKEPKKHDGAMSTLCFSLIYISYLGYVSVYVYVCKKDSFRPGALM